MCDTLAKWVVVQLNLYKNSRFWFGHDTCSCCKVFIGLGYFNYGSIHLCHWRHNVTFSAKKSQRTPFSVFTCSLAQWNWFSVVAGCTWVTCISEVREPISLHQDVQKFVSQCRWIPDVIFSSVRDLIALWSRSVIAQSKAASNHTEKAMGCHPKVLSYPWSKRGHSELFIDFSKVFLCVRVVCEPQWKVLIWAEIRRGSVQERSPPSELESSVAAAPSRSWTATFDSR